MRLKAMFGCQRRSVIIDRHREEVILNVWIFDPGAAAELRGFAQRAAGVPFLIMLSNSAPSLVLGRIAGLDVLGIYSLAQRLCSLPSEIALPIFGTVLTPAYAGIRDDLARVRRIWVKTLTGVALLVMPIVAALVVLDERLPSVLYGEKYTGSPGLVSMIATAALSLSGFITMRPPAEAIWAAQVFIGLAVGVRYSGVSFYELRRFVLAGALLSLLLALLTVAYFALGVWLFQRRHQRVH